MLLAASVAVAAAAAVYVHIQADRDARHAAERDARSSAQIAAGQLGHGVAVVQTTVRGLAANPQVASTIDHPAGCALTYGGLGGADDRGHIDLIRTDGTVACSSLSGKHSYAGSPWLARALHSPVFAAPITDRVTGKKMAVTAVPVPGHGVVAGFGDLEAIGPQLAALYGGGRPIVFLLLSKDGKTILARSEHARRWIGVPIASTPFARHSGVGRNDVEGVPRLYEKAMVPGVGWQLYAGENRSTVLAAANSLQRRQLEIILAGFAVTLLVAFLVYRHISRPLTALGKAVRDNREGGTLEPVPVGGPAELAGLGKEINGLIGTVGGELMQRRDVEEHLRLSEASYRHLFEQHPAPMWVYEPETLRFLTVNTAALEVYGYSRDEFLGMTIRDIRPADERDTLEQFLARPSSGRVDAGTWTHQAKGGERIEVAVSSNDITFEGRLARLVLAQDVTQQRRLEEQLRRAHRMEAIGNLAGGVAHDFNNVLMVIRTGCSLLLRREENARLRSDLERIDGAAARGAELTQQLLTFSRRQVLRPQLTDVNAVVEETLGMLDRILGEDIEVEAGLDPDLPQTNVDRTRLGQVILNLAINARDAMPDGGTLTMRTASVDLTDRYAAEHIGVEPGRYVLLQVTDAGVGMDEETRERLFDPFYTTKEEGTGLGLATVYGIVKQSGGHIWVYSEVDIGTTFKIYLPRADVPAATETDEPEPAVLGGHERILVVEDEEILRSLVADSLRSYGYTVVEAAGGLEAVEIAHGADEPFDLLLTDLVMPGMNGRELAEQLQADNPALVVLFTSGYPEERAVRHGIASAHLHYIEKPYLPDDLARKIREVLHSAAVG